MTNYVPVVDIYLFNEINFSFDYLVGFYQRLKIKQGVNFIGNKKKLKKSNNKVNKTDTPTNSAQWDKFHSKVES